MTLFLSMLPFYLAGNLHCIGMCGPLVMMIGRHRFRYAYFLGRTLSFSLVGMAAGEAGALLMSVLQAYHISIAASFALAGCMLLVGVTSLIGRIPFRFPSLPPFLQKINHTLSLLILRDQPLATFLFGFFTVLLPCGQTVVVFSACALSGDWFVGLFNGCAFALLTSPSLLLAMHAFHVLKQAKQHYHQWLGAAALIAGTLAFCRGLAEGGLISHFALGSPSQTLHLVIY